MAHIPLPDGLPGIRGLLTYSPTTAKPMGDLAEVLLRGPSTLTKGEREMIAALVSVTETRAISVRASIPPSPRSTSVARTPTTRSSIWSSRTSSRRQSRQR